MSQNQTIEELKKELDHYKRLYRLGEHDLSIRGYEAFSRIVEQQIEYLKDFNIKSSIEGKKTETVMYDRSIDLWEKLPDMISKLNRLRIELKLEFNHDHDKPREQATRPELIAASKQ